MAADVQVVLSSPVTGTQKKVTREVIEDVRYSSAAIGGFDTLNLTLKRPIDAYSRDVDPFVLVTVYDPATGGILWDGTLDEPGRGGDRGAPLWDLAAEGGRAHVTDLPQPVIYIDTRLSEWERVDDFGTTGIPNATVDYTGGTGETPGLRIGFARGLEAPPQSTVTVRYPHLLASGQGIGRVQVTHFEGLSTTNANIDLLVRTAALAGVLVGTHPWSTTPNQLVITRSLIGSSTYKYADWRPRLSVGGTVGTDVTYAQAQFMAILGTRLTAAGAELVGAGDYTVNYVLPHQVVADLLGRMLPLFDGADATVDTSALVQLQQFAYENGAEPGQILTDLMNQAPTHRWAAWERNAAGKYHFEWVPWDTTPTLFASGGKLSSPGSAAGLCDTVRVRWVNAQGKVQWATYTQDNPLLTAAGRRRTRLVDLGSEVGSADAAASAASAALNEGLWPTNNGTLTVRKPVRDLTSGRLLHPRELPRYAGRLIQLADVEGWTSTLNPSDRDGSAVYRMAAVSYSSKDRAATVTLDAYENTVEAALIRSGRLQARLRRP